MLKSISICDGLLFRKVKRVQTLLTMKGKEANVNEGTAVVEALFQWKTDQI